MENASDKDLILTIEGMLNTRMIQCNLPQSINGNILIDKLTKTANYDYYLDILTDRYERQ